MRKIAPTILKIFFVVADILSIVFSFSLAYFVRTHLDDRPYFFTPNLLDFVWMVIFLIPLWLIILAVSGLYQRTVYMSRQKEYARLLLVSVISMMALISYEFFTSIEIFPVRIIALYFIAINFIIMIIVRELVKLVRRVLIDCGVGLQTVVIIGDNETTLRLAEDFMTKKSYGYVVKAIVANTRNIPVNATAKQFASFDKAVKHIERPDVIIQTDHEKTDKIYAYAIDHHVLYMFVPCQDVPINNTNKVEIIAGQPMVAVQPTRLSGGWSVLKRLLDIVFGVILFIIVSPLMLIILLAEAFSGGDPIYKTTRLTRFNEKVGIYKFRTHKHAFNRLMPEEAFAKMGRPGLLKEYRANGDQLDDDPRVSRLGKFLRATSLDELPQLVNVVKGDISLVGPRPLVPYELNQYADKNTILTVRSGLTGLAQVSGRRDISFEERRRLDLVYVQNWSLWLDFKIFLKTFKIVLFRKGAR